MKILIVKLSAIGDVIHTLPALCALRRHWPAARIDWVVEEAAADLVLGHPDLDRAIVSRRKAWIRDLSERGKRSESVGQIRRFVGELRRTRYDLVLDFQALLKSALVVALARARHKVGFGPGLEHMEHSYHVLTEKIPPPGMEVHALERNLIMIRALGVPASRIEYRIPVADKDRAEMDLLLANNGIDRQDAVLAINPVAQWPTKLWPEAHFAALADRIMHHYNVPVVFTGAPGDARPVSRILAAMRQPAIDLSGQTSLKQLAALYRRSCLVVSTDTGPMHLAAAMGTPVVALFGPTAPWRTGPFGPGHRVVRAPVDCAPCFKRRCAAGGCMGRIQVEAAWTAVAEILNGKPETGRSARLDGSLDGLQSGI